MRERYSIGKGMEYGRMRGDLSRSYDDIIIWFASRCSTLLKSDIDNE